VPAPDDYYPPLQLDGWWWLIALGLIGLGVLWWWLTTFTSRIRWWFPHWPFARKPRPAQVPRRPLAEMKAEALHVIGAIAAARERGDITSRESHLKLSAALRAFASEALQDASPPPDVSAMTLEDLRAHRLDSLADAVARYYPIAFAPDESRGIKDAVASARRVVNSWS
jgi:hypothetical protein